MITTAVMMYIDKYGSFDSNGWDLADPELEVICQKALNEKREIKFSELYKNDDAIV